MPESDSNGKKRAREGEGLSSKKRFRLDGTSIRTKSHIDGPGVWASCIRGKEKGAVGELYDVFESLASDMWPPEDPDTLATGGSDLDKLEGSSKEEKLSLEEQIAREVSEIKRPRREGRFVNCQTNTQCVVFISCKPPVDPVELVIQHIKNVKETGVSRTRFVQRLVPVSDTCAANFADIQSLCRRVFEPFFAKHDDRKFTYKIEPRIRNHTTLDRMSIIQTVAQCIPEGHTVSLTEPEIFILIEIFKNTFGVSIVEGYYSLAKFNVMELANQQKMSDVEQKGRVQANKQLVTPDPEKS